MNRSLKNVMLVVLGGLVLTGCKFYGGAVPPENPISMDNALSRSQNRAPIVGPSGEPLPAMPRPQVDRPSYVPEKELAIVAPPRTLLVWNFPHVTDDNTRVFGSWSTIFLTDRYEWVLPENEQAAASGR